jgi:predicted Zn-dependent protease
MLAEALSGRKEHTAAAEELEIAVKIEPKTLSLQLALADAYAKAGQNDKAKKTLKAILAAEPDYPGAAEMLDKIR